MEDSALKGLGESMAAAVENFSNWRNANRQSVTTVAELCIRRCIQTE